MFNLGEFNQHIANKDFQRTNLFSVVFATTPSSKTQGLLDQFGEAIYNNLPFDIGGIFGVKQGDMTKAVTSVINMGTKQLVRKSGVSKYLIGAMTNRTVQSLLGEFETGTFIMDFFNMAFPTEGLMVYSVKIPENRLSHEDDKLHNSPGVKITSRELDPLVLSFRMDDVAANYRAMHDWVNAVVDPVTGLRSLPVDVEADIQVNLHGRDGLPHTVCMFTGAIPVGVSSPQLSYDGTGEISTFDVTFAYRVMQMGAVDRQGMKEWFQDKVEEKIKDINPHISKTKYPWQINGNLK